MVLARVASGAETARRLPGCRARRRSRWRSRSTSPSQRPSATLTLTTSSQARVRCRRRCCWPSAGRCAELNGVSRTDTTCSARGNSARMRSGVDVAQSVFEPLPATALLHRAGLRRPLAAHHDVGRPERLDLLQRLRSWHLRRLRASRSPTRPRTTDRATVRNERSLCSSRLLIPSRTVRRPVFGRLIIAGVAQLPLCRSVSPVPSAYLRGGCPRHHCLAGLRSRGLTMASVAIRDSGSGSSRPGRWHEHDAGRRPARPDRHLDVGQVVAAEHDTWLRDRPLMPSSSPDVVRLRRVA